MTTPTGKLAYGQAASYDAVDDRAVITAVTGGRVGLVRPVEVRAGAGLNIIITGGWAGVAGCGDLTSAIVGSRDEIAVQGNPGLATGSRQDYVWCDTDPDAGTWELRVISVADAARRPGIPLVLITVPPNANLASQMTLLPVDAGLERRILQVHSMNFSGGGWSDTTWANAAGSDFPIEAYRVAVMMEPGQWYRVRATWSSLQWVSGTSLSARIGVGWRTAGAPATAAVNTRTAAVSFAAVGRPQGGDVEWVFRHAKTDARVERWFSTRAWAVGQHQMYIGINEGPHMVFTVEDIGS